MSNISPSEWVFGGQAMTDVRMPVSVFDVERLISCSGNVSDLRSVRRTVSDRIRSLERERTDVARGLATQFEVQLEACERMLIDYFLQDAQEAELRSALDACRALLSNVQAVDGMHFIDPQLLCVLDAMDAYSEN